MVSVVLQGKVINPLKTLVNSSLRKNLFNVKHWIRTG